MDATLEFGRWLFVGCYLPSSLRQIPFLGGCRWIGVISVLWSDGKKFIKWENGPQEKSHMTHSGDTRRAWVFDVILKIQFFSYSKSVM